MSTAHFPVGYAFFSLKTPGTAGNGGPAMRFGYDSARGALCHFFRARTRNRGEEAKSGGSSFDRTARADALVRPASVRRRLP